jgi:D-alanine-D-alanine ligase-like ATP-grasp enzyme
MEAVMLSQIKASLGFLAAGNIYFAGHCAVLRLSDQAKFEHLMSFDAALAIAMPDLQSDQALTLEPEAFGKQEPSTFVGQVARLALAVQHLAGFAGAEVPGWCEVTSENSLAAFICMDRATGQAAAALALNIMTGGRETDRAQLAKRLLEAGKPWGLPLAKAAMARGIPVGVAAASDRPFLALGQGEKRRLFWRNFTPNTSHVATTLSTRKDLTSRLLREAGLPAPRNVVVQDAENAVRVAEGFGYPVVVKPVAADFGRGVSTGNQNSAEVHKAFQHAAKYGPVLIEEQISGENHRLLVMHGRCVRVMRTLSAQVVGDGNSMVSELVAANNLNRRDRLTVGFMIKLDEQAIEILDRQGLTPSSVPSNGQVVLLGANANRRNGASAELVTELAHPDVFRLAIQTATLLGIDVAGIDYLTSDVTRSPAETGGAICEVNVTPAFISSEEVVAGQLDPFFSAGCEGRIPIVCVVRASDAPRALIDALASYLGPDAARSDDVRFWREHQPAALSRRTSAILSDPLASAAIITCASHEINITGLGLDRCTLAVLEQGVPKDIVAALLRIAIDVIMPASLYQEMAEELVLTEKNGSIWLVGETAEFLSGDFAGWVRRVAPDKIEISPRFCATWSIVHAAASEDAEILVAAGAALAAPTNRISESLRLLDIQQ